jgi:putative flippase GtrA
MALSFLKKQTTTAGKFLGFLIAGLPSFVVAIPLNWALVQRTHMSMPLAYGVVMLVQVSINFVFCRLFVFETNTHTSLLRQFAAFSGGMLVFRAIDWAVYFFIIQVFPKYYIVVQVSNIFLFSLLKFAYSRRVFCTRTHTAF